MSIPRGKAPVIDVAMTGVQEMGGNHILSVMLPLLRAVLKPGIVPEAWNKTALNMIWNTRARTGIPTRTDL